MWRVLPAQAVGKKKFMQAENSPPSPPPLPPPVPPPVPPHFSNGASLNASRSYF